MRVSENRKAFQGGVQREYSLLQARKEFLIVMTSLLYVHINTPENWAPIPPHIKNQVAFCYINTSMRFLSETSEKNPRANSVADVFVLGTELTSSTAL